MVRFGKVRRCVRAKLARSVAAGAFAVWAVLAFVVATSLAAAHLYTLPKPGATDAVLLSAIRGLRGERDTERWLAVHVLYASCRCSLRVLEHLARGRRPEHVSEKLLVVGDAGELAGVRRMLAPAGFDVTRVTPEELRAHFHVQSAPLLLVVDPGDVVRYAGGYSDRKQGLRLRDVEIIRDLVAQRRPEELPLFGCAVSRELQSLLDPISVVAPRGRSALEAP